MKKLLSILFVLLIVAGITGCKNTEDDVLHLGLNAIIVEINHKKHLIYVSDTEHEDVFGELPLTAARLSNGTASSMWTMIVIPRIISTSSNLRI